MLIENLFVNSDDTKCVFKTILTELDYQREQIETVAKKKSYLIFDNANLIIRHFNGNPFKLIHFINDCRKREGFLKYLLAYFCFTVSQYQFR